MTNKTFDKIIGGRTLSPKDLTPDEKKDLYALFEAHGMTRSTCYLRFFDKGFDEWEISGISNIIDIFLHTSSCVSWSDYTNKDGSQGYAAVLALAHDNDDGRFYDIVTNLKIGNKLVELMAKKGMKSQTTVRTRFKANDWKPWERKGIRRILEENNLIETTKPNTAKQ